MMLTGIASIDAQLLEYALAMLRPGAMLLAAPLFGAAAVPVQVRVMLAVAIGALTVTTADFSTPTRDLISLGGLVFVICEVVIGLAIGFALQIGVAAAQVGGETVSNAMGLGFASMQDPVSGTSSPVVGQVFVMLATLCFLATGGHLLLVELVVDSYAIVPPGLRGPQPDAIRMLVDFGGLMFAAGVSIALPVASLLIGVQLAMAFVARSAPAFNLFAVGIPATLLVGVIMLGLAAPQLTWPMSSALEAALEMSARVVR